MSKVALHGALLLAVALGVATAQADLLVSTPVTPQSFDLQDSMPVTYTILNTAASRCDLRSSIQILDECGNVLYASSWSARRIESGESARFTWEDRFVRGLLAISEAKSLRVKVWIELGPRQLVAGSCTFRRAHGAVFARSDYDPANPLPAGAVTLVRVKGSVRPLAIDSR